MEEVSGQYKRRTQLFCFLIALVTAVLLNVDSFALFRALWQHPAFAAEITAVHGHDLSEALNDLKALPVGWDAFPPHAEPFAQWAVRSAGWLLTASSALFGAPFWFDLLQKIVQLRGARRRPAISETVASERQDV
jgi:hypothetical protein